MKNNPKMKEVILRCLKDPNLLNELKKDPKKLIEKELKIQLPDSYQLEVLQETSQKGYIVLPASEALQECSEEDLNAIAGGEKPFTETKYCYTHVVGGKGCG